jgi:hypothetical protein
MKLLDLGGETSERERVCDGRTGCPRVGGNNGGMSSLKEKDV